MVVYLDVRVLYYYNISEDGQFKAGELVLSADTRISKDENISLEVEIIILSLMLLYLCNILYLVVVREKRFFIYFSFFLMFGRYAELNLY